MARKKKRASAQRSAAAGVNKIQSTGRGAAASATSAAAGAASTASSSVKTGAAATTAGLTGARLSGNASTASVSGKRLKGWRRYTPPNGKGKYPWRKRWLGLVPLAGLAVFGGWWGWDHVEDRLDERAIVHLACEGIDADELDMDWSYRDVTIEGELPPGVTPDRVKQIIDEGSDDTECLAERADEAGIDLDADADPGVYDVNVAALAAAPLVLPTAEPEPTAVPQPTATAVPEPTAAPAATATPVPEPTPTEVAEPTAVPIAVALDTQGGYDGRTITLAGVVASEAQRQTLVDAAIAAVSDGNVVDELEIDEARAADGNDGLVGDLANVVGLFGDELLEGSAQLADGALTWDVLARDQGIADGLSLPGTGTLDVAAPRAPTFTG